MSVDGVSNNLDQNSGEIKVRYSQETMTIDNSDNENSSLIVMGYPVEDVTSEEEPVNLFYKQIGESIDESAVIFNDVRTVEEWLRNRSEIDDDTIRNDYLYFGTDDIGSGNEDGKPSPLIISDNPAEPSAHNINWDDLVLDPDIGIFKDKNNFVVLGTHHRSKTDIVTQDANNLEAVTGLSQKLETVKPSTRSSFSIDNKSLVSELKLQVANDSSTDLTLVKSNLKKQAKPKPLCKNLPFVKIPKNCLMKGKILGKGDISLLTGKATISFLNSAKTLNTVNTNSTSTNSDQTEIMKKPNILRDKPRSRTTHMKQPLNVNSEKPIMVLPGKPVNKVSNSALTRPSKFHHSRSVLKNNISNKNVTKTLSTNMDFCEIPKTDASKTNVPLPVAVVAISTNKSNNTTEILIRTEDGENVFKGKTSDIMKATGSIINYSDQPSLQSEKARTPCDKEYDDSINELLMKLFGVSGDALEEFEGSSSQSHLKCPVDGCKYTSLKGSWLKVHVLQHYGIRPFKCTYPDCNWAFYTNFRLKRHQEVHYKEKVFHCPVENCGRTFSTIYNVNSHLKLHDRPTAVTCNIGGCNREFQTRRSYEKHLQEHGPEYAPYTCLKNGCGKKYFTVNSLNSHSRIHQHDEKELRCPYCEKLFDQPCRLKAHINTHIGVKPYKCDFEGCRWAFTTSSKLRRHQRKHTQLRKHVCEVCKKSFLRPEHLKDHSLKHFVKKSFICPISGCATVFANKSSMYAHLKRHRNQGMKSNETTTFPCPMDSCSLVFNTKESLRTHMQLSHVLTGLINNENSQDAIQLLSDDNLTTLESLQGNISNSGPGIVSFNSMSQEGLLVGMSDLVQCIPIMEQGDFPESDSSNIITHVVFTDNLADLPEKNQALEETSELVEAEMNIGSARTGIPYQAGVKDKPHPSLAEMTGESSGGLHSASDVVLSAGLLVGHDNLERGLLLQDELSGGDLYPSQEESGLLGTAGELQVLLLEHSAREQTSDFEQSTINLRDLE